MKLDISILRHSFRKYLCNIDFLEKYNAENLQDFAQTRFYFQFFLDDRCQNVNADGYPDLSLDGILGSSEERLDSQILLDSFEKDFYPPAARFQQQGTTGL